MKNKKTYMKKLLYFAVPLMLFACSGSEEQPDAYGNFEAEELFMSAEASGKIVQMNVEEGDEVSEGDVIAIIDTTQLFLKKGQIRASMAALGERLQNIPKQLNVYYEQEIVLEKEYTRMSRLLEGGAATQKQFDDISGQLSIVRKQREALESQLSTGNKAVLSELKPLQWQLRQLEDAIEKSICTAPKGGTILSKYRYAGEFIGPGQPIAKLADLTNMTLRMYVSGDQLAGLEMGRVVNVNVDGTSGELVGYSGVITWISSKAEFTPKTVQTRAERVNQVYAVKVNVPNDGKLKIGMPAEIKFQ